jgi:hypothetical protein
LVPVAEELLGTPLEQDTHLRAVRRNTPYTCEEEYMDTYFRLLRVECFSAVQEVRKPFPVYRVYGIPCAFFLSRYPGATRHVIYFFVRK